MAGCLLQEFVVGAYAQLEKSHLKWIRFNQMSSDLRCKKVLLMQICNWHGLRSNWKSFYFHSWSTSYGWKIPWFNGHSSNYIETRSIYHHDLQSELAWNITRMREIWTKSQESEPRHRRAMFQTKTTSTSQGPYQDERLHFKFYVIEIIQFQKWGLPHTHILIILHTDDKPRTPNIINSILCMELPDRNTHPEVPELSESVTAHRLTYGWYKGKMKLLEIWISHAITVYREIYSLRQRSINGYITSVHLLICNSCYYNIHGQPSNSLRNLYSSACHSFLLLLGPSHSNCFSKLSSLSNPTLLHTAHD